MRAVFIEGVTTWNAAKDVLEVMLGSISGELSSLGIAGAVHGAVSTVRQCCEGAGGKGVCVGDGRDDPKLCRIG